MKVNIERISADRQLGEGPHWDEKKQCLYYVDIVGNSIHKYVPSTNTHTKALLDKHVSFIIPVSGQDNRFLVGSELDIVQIAWDGVSENVTEWQNIAEVDGIRNFNKLNDGKADPSGRLWTGTCGPPSQESSSGFSGTSCLYCLERGGKPNKQLTDVSLSNGLAFSPDSKKFYYIDSMKNTIDQFDYDVENGTIDNRQTLFTCTKHDMVGLPDGQTIDTDGNLWVAMFNGGKIIKIDTRQPETLIGVLEMPAVQVTSLAFGGKNLDELYVTSGRMDFWGKASLSVPENGALYKVTGLGVRGLPAVDVRL